MENSGDTACTFKKQGTHVLPFFKEESIMAMATKNKQYCVAVEKFTVFR